MSRLLGKKLTKKGNEKIVAHLDGTIYEDEDINSTYKEKVKSSSDSHDDSFEVDQISNTVIQHDSKYWPLTTIPPIFTLS